MNAPGKPPRGVDGAASVAHLDELARIVPGVLCNLRLEPDGGSTIPYASPGIEQIFGVSLDVLAGDAAPAFDAVHPDDIATVRRTLDASSAALAPWRCDFRVLHPVRGEIWIEGRSVPIRETDGATLWYGLLIDITERKHGELALRDRERELEQAQRLGRVGHWRLDVTTGEALWSAQLSRLHGRPAVQQSKRIEDSLDDIHPDDRPRVGEVIMAVMQDGESRSLDYRLVGEGSERWLHGLFELEYDALGQARILRGTAQDVTERKAREAQLLRTQARLRAALGAGSIGLFELEIATGCVWLDEACTALLGRNEGTLRTFDDVAAIVHPEDREAFAAQLAHAEGGARIPTMELRHLRPDGTIQWLLGRAHVELGADGMPERIVGATQDITQRKRLERLRALEVEVAAAIAFADTLSTATADMLALLAGEVGALEGLLWFPHDGASLQLHRHLSCDGQGPSQTVRACEPSTTPWVESAWSTRALVEGRGQAVRARADCVPLQGLASAFALPIVHGDECFAVLEVLCRAPLEMDDDLHHVLESLGDRLGQLAARLQDRRDAQRLLSLSPNAVYSLHHKDGATAFRWLAGDLEHLTGFRPTEMPTAAEWLARLPKDAQKPVLATHADLERADEGGVTVEYRWRHRDGRVRWLRDERRVTRDARGKREVIGVLSDVTSRVELEAQLRQSQKMEAVGMLAGGVAHDFNNLLTVIQSDATLLRDESAPDSEVAELAQEVVEAADRAASLTRQLLLFSRRDATVQPRVIDPVEIIHGIERMIRRSIGEDVSLRTTLATLPLHVRIDPGQLEQLVVNLAVNARDAMPQGGELTVATRAEVLDDAFCARNQGAQPGPHVVLSMVDTGVGMSPETAERIFEPFFTTKDRGRGTGLGLAICFGIVSSAGGFIRVESGLGEGTRFDVFLPGVPPERGDEDATEETRTEDSEGLILLVEDEPLVRRALTRCLARRGYRVLAPSKPTEAPAVIQERGPELTLLITDVVMPELSGPDLVAIAQQLDPDLPVLYVSGYVDDAVQRHGFEVHPSAFLEKPISPARLLERVSELMRSPR